MATDRYYKEQFKCPECGAIQKHYQWLSQAETVTHNCASENCLHTITHLDISENIESQVIIINGKMTKEEIKKDRKKRSKEHFEKEVMPYQPKSTQRMFALKGYRNR